MSDFNSKIDLKPSGIKPIVKKGGMLGYARELKEKGLWPLRLHDRKNGNNQDERPTATPFLIIPAYTGDNGARPLPNSLALHSPSIWIEDTIGNIISTPVAGGNYVIKCRVINIGAFASYGGLINFYVEKPGLLNGLVGTNTSIQPFGSGGFSLLPGIAIDIRCPRLWNPLTENDLARGILVQAFDFIKDMYTSKFDARNDRHIGRHDFTSDFYVRDWTYSGSVHDTGREPSADPAFFVRSDVWNRRSDDPGAFVNDQPSNQNPQAGNAAAGNNFMFARISRNDASTRETVSAHFMFAEFGTGSPYVDCSTGPDPSVSFLPGETSKIISQPWHLHPTSSQHLCIAVQIYSESDVYMPPGLTGYTPGWPTSDLMVINDNNKAQRNISVWDGVPDEPGMQFAMVYNGATIARDVELLINTSVSAVNQFRNARVNVFGSDRTLSLQENTKLIIPQMLPGETRWVTLSYDGFTVQEGERLQVMFNEMQEGQILNGYCIELRAASKKELISSTLALQLRTFSRMEAMKVKQAGKGLELCQRLIEANVDAGQYLKALRQISEILEAGITEMSYSMQGIKDVFGIAQSLEQLRSYNKDRNVLTAIAHHQKLLNQMDAWQTTIIKSNGDEASILFTVRLQRDIYSKEQLRIDGCMHEMLGRTDYFINAWSEKKVTSSDYPSFISSMLEYFKLTTEHFPSGVLRKKFQALAESLNGSVAGIQKAHIGFLNDLLKISAGKYKISRSKPGSSSETSQWQS